MICGYQIIGLSTRSYLNFFHLKISACSAAVKFITSFTFQLINLLVCCLFYFRLTIPNFLFWTNSRTELLHSTKLFLSITRNYIRIAIIIIRFSQFIIYLYFRYWKFIFCYLMHFIFNFCVHILWCHTAKSFIFFYFWIFTENRFNLIWHTSDKPVIFCLWYFILYAFVFEFLFFYFSDFPPDLFVDVSILGHIFPYFLSSSLALAFRIRFLLVYICLVSLFLRFFVILSIC